MQVGKGQRTKRSSKCVHAARLLFFTASRSMACGRRVCTVCSQNMSELYDITAATGHVPFASRMNGVGVSSLEYPTI